jgi:hypothetical protein
MRVAGILVTMIQINLAIGMAVGAVKVKARGLPVPHNAEEARRMQLFARGRAVDMDYDPEKVFVTPEEKTFSLNGEEHNYGGAAFKDGTINLYSKQLFLTDIKPVLAHEIMRRRNG